MIRLETKPPTDIPSHLAQQYSDNDLRLGSRLAIDNLQEALLASSFSSPLTRDTFQDEYLFWQQQVQDKQQHRGEPLPDLPANLGRVLRIHRAGGNLIIDAHITLLNEATFRHMPREEKGRHQGHASIEVEEVHPEGESQTLNPVSLYYDMYHQDTHQALAEIAHATIHPQYIPRRLLARLWDQLKLHEVTELPSGSATMSIREEPVGFNQIQGLGFIFGLQEKQ